MKRVLFLFLTLTLLLYLSLRDQGEITLTLRMDRHNMVKGDEEKIVVSVYGDDLTALKRAVKKKPTIDGLENFYVNSRGPLYRFEKINGQLIEGAYYIYYIIPKKTGTFTIGPAKLRRELNGFYKSNEASLTVSELNAAKSGSDSLFLTASLSSPNAFVGEPILYHIRLYRQVEVFNVMLTLPEAEFLHFKKMNETEEYDSIYEGKAYKVREIQNVLIPLKAGYHDIQPARIEMLAQTENYNSELDFLFRKSPHTSTGQLSPRTLLCKIQRLNVLPLPKRGIPEKFSGLVGRFEMESTLSPSEIKTGEKTILTVILKGRGNIDFIPDLRLTELEEAKIYSVGRPLLNVTQDKNGFKCVKAMKWAIVPEVEGQIEIPQLSLSYFDIKARQYRILKTRSHPLSVQPGTVHKLEVVNGFKTKKVINTPKIQDKDDPVPEILGIHNFHESLISSHAFSFNLFLFLVLSGPVFLFLGGFIVFRYKNRSMEDKLKTKAKRAVKEFTKQCRQDAFGENDFLLIFRDYLNNRLGLSLGAVTANEARQILDSHGVPDETKEETINLLEKCEDSVYGGRGRDPWSNAADIIKLIKKIDKAIS